MADPEEIPQSYFSSPSGVDLDAKGVADYANVIYFNTSFTMLAEML